jgi:hypothetical protein
VLQFSAHASTAYLVRRNSRATNSLPFETVSGTPASAPKTLGSHTIGISK